MKENASAMPPACLIGALVAWLRVRALVHVPCLEFTMNQMTESSSSVASTVALPRIALVCAQWHADIVHQARDAAVAAWAARGVPADRVTHFDVPGAFEIPLLTQSLARSGQYDAIVACALVVNGGIYRHEFVAGAVVDGLMRVQLDTGVPVFSAVLTPHDFHEHEEHRAFFRAHFVKKGEEVANACLGALALLTRVPRR
jgi:6,7-dimethyl-8-ribityllumazine synthase